MSFASATPSTMLVPMAGKYQKRSARTVGRRIGMFETGKYEITTHMKPTAIVGATTLLRPISFNRFSRIHEWIHKTIAANGGPIKKSAPSTLSGNTKRAGTGSCGAE
jgi:hypothetical protein